MKRILIFTVFIFLIKGIACAGNGDDVKVKLNAWFIDSYNYGNSGNNCSRIYYNYGTDKWTFNSDDPTLLKKLYEACKIGEEDRVTGENNLPQILDNFQKQK
jgi:hypothetical protein